MTTRVGVALTRNGVDEAVHQAMAMADCDGCIGLAAKVLVKPNLHGGDGFTSMEVIKAVVHWASRMGASQIVVGDGPYYGMDDAFPYFERIGLVRLCDEMKVSLVSFHDSDYDEIVPNLEALPQTLGITKWVRWADAVVSVPVMKTHFNTLTTLAMKNLKGFLRPRDKRDLHSRDLHLALAAIGWLVRPTVNIIDGFVAYEGMGPSNATPVDMGVVVASQSTFHADVVANWLMGFDPATVRYLREAEKLGCGTLPRSDDDVAALTGCSLRHLQRLRRQFQHPYEAAERAYPNLRISAELACSGCLMNLFTALRDLAGEGLAERLTGTVAIGKAPEAVDLALGNCTCACWGDTEHLVGCPPLIPQIAEALRKLAQTPA